MILMTNSKKPEVVSMIGRKMRVLVSGQIGTLEKITLDYTQTQMTYHVRCGAKVWACPAGTVSWV